MDLLNFFKINKRKKINIKNLPSQGLFYADDFEIYITKLDKDYINEYKTKLDVTSLQKLLKRITRVIIDHTSFNNEYTYRNIVSIDLFFIFLEIVKYTTNKPIIINHYDDENDIDVRLEFNEENFNYFKPTEEMSKSYNYGKKCFELNGYMISPPTTGVEEDLTELLNSISSLPGSEIYNDYNYNFIYVLGNKTSINVKEIKNLIQIFNNDITKEEEEKLKDAVSKITSIQKYEIKYNNIKLSLSSIDLFKIFD